jgi:tetratricopeptide (TPR) repeat protein
VFSSGTVKEQLAWATRFREQQPAACRELLEQVLKRENLLLEERQEARWLLAWLLFRAGEIPETERLLQQLRAEPLSRTQALNLKISEALLLDQRGEVVQAREQLLWVVAAARQDTLDGVLCLGANTLGNLLGRSGDLENAFVLHLEALVAARRVGSLQDECFSLTQLGIIHHRKGQLEEARSFYQQALKRAREAGFLRVQAICHNNLAILSELCGELEKALEHHQHSLKLKLENGDKAGEATSWNNIGFILFRQGKLERAEVVFAEAERLATGLGFVWLRAYIAYGRGQVALKKSEFDTALLYGKTCLGLRRELQSHEGIASALALCAKAILQQKDVHHPALGEVVAWIEEAVGLLPLAPVQDVQLVVWEVARDHALLLQNLEQAAVYQEYIDRLQQATIR